ncbi:hypothetical protein NDQ72_06395 [Halomonas sp. KG2]|uniref:hypothetical protein n=1 Tax=Halomonas sp. KG2 TaxID=2951138 RepID=UPI0026476AFF|nr:hypothetical protein [Halomonas sp. KG2]WKD29569.1 hypothetical protein NDQ72_06395 [Halomonas sp. KG2]
MNTYTDAYLEYYADRYVALYLKGHGITLQQYLAAPDRYEHLAFAPLPLLPAQNNVVLRLWHAWDTGLAPTTSEPTVEEPCELPGVYAVWEEFLLALGNNKAIRQRNGAFIEPLRHHRHNARNRSANFARKGAGI